MSDRAIAIHEIKLSGEQTQKKRASVQLCLLVSTLQEAENYNNCLSLLSCIMLSVSSLAV